MMEQQTCRLFIEVFKPGLGNGFQQRNTHIIRHTCFNLSLCTFVIRCISKDHDGYCAEITFAFHYSSKKLINLSNNYVGTMPLDGKSKLKKFV